MTSTKTELIDFVKTQAEVDAALSPSERKFQEELVADVLGQEAKTPKALKELINLYRKEKQAA